MAKPERTAPAGTSTLWANWRQGLKDLQHVVLNPFPQGHVAQHEEPGTIANPTQVEVYKHNHPEQSASGVHGPKAETSPAKAHAPSEPTPQAPEPAGGPQPNAPKRDPLDRARENAREASRERGRDRSPEM